jgi:hypothetical protein
MTAFRIAFHRQLSRLRAVAAGVNFYGDLGMVG